nr:4685_t:CDS:2 [Entrophospora candida]CAG8488160.1 5693_t:CDS:2 [Entrophospora candida]
MHSQSKSSQGISPTYQQKHQYPPPQKQNNPPIGMPQQINPTHQIDMQQHPPPKNINANTYPGQVNHSIPPVERPLNQITSIEQIWVIPVIVRLRYRAYYYYYYN